MAGGVIRIEVGVAMRSVAGSAIADAAEIPETEWAAMSPEQRRTRLDELATAARDVEVTAWAVLEEDPGEEDRPWPARHRWKLLYRLGLPGRSPRYRLPGPAGRVRRVLQR